MQAAPFFEVPARAHLVARRPHLTRPSVHGQVARHPGVGALFLRNEGVVVPKRARVRIRPAVDVYVVVRVHDATVDELVNGARIVFRLVEAAVLENGRAQALARTGRHPARGGDGPSSVPSRRDIAR